MALTFLRNFNIPMGENGTPKSGQLVKWSWVTGLGVLVTSLACWKQKRHVYGCSFPAPRHQDILVPELGRTTYILDAELAYGVIHKDGEVFHRHPHVPVHPAALIGPVLVTLVLPDRHSLQLITCIKS